jgi:large subunit ribosomal protein L10
MNREQKAAAIAEIAAQIEGAQAILAVDYRGISVPQVAELRAGLRQADASFRVVKNSLTERAAEQSGAQTLKPMLSGPTALAFVRGDVATAAKTIADYGRATQLLAFKGGLMDGAALDVEQIRSLSRLPSREVLYGQLVGIVASPVSGLVRSLGALLGGLAVALGQVREKMQSGAIAPGAPDASDGAQDAPAEQPEGGVQTESAPAEAVAEEQAPGAGATQRQPAEETEKESAEPAQEQPPEPEASQEQTATAPSEEDSEAPAEEQPVAAEASQTHTAQDQTEPDESPAQPDDEANASSEAHAAGAAEKSAKED